MQVNVLLNMDFYVINTKSISSGWSVDYTCLWLTKKRWWHTAGYVVTENILGRMGMFIYVCYWQYLWK